MKAASEAIKQAGSMAPLVRAPRQATGAKPESTADSRSGATKLGFLHRNQSASVSDWAFPAADFRLNLLAQWKRPADIP
jgi:hypothetical protein